MIDPNYKYHPILESRITYKNTAGVNLIVFLYRRQRLRTLFYYKYPLLV